MAPLVWLVTGTTLVVGIGLSMVRAISARGDLVIASGRSAATRLAHIASDSVRPLDLDVTASPESIDSAVAAAISIWGRIDVLINNAAISTTTALEEASMSLLQSMFNVNLFGSIKVTNAVLPHMRAQGRGKIGFIGAGLAWAPMSFFGVYSMTKAALTIYVEGLHKEVARFGVDAVIFEPGGFDTALASAREAQGGVEAVGKPPRLAEYLADFGDMFAEYGAEAGGDTVGDVEKFGNVVADVIKGEAKAKGRKWAVRVVVGPDSLALVRQKCREQLQLCDEWEDVGNSATRDAWSGNVSQVMMRQCSMLR